MAYPEPAIQSSFVYDDGVNAPIRHQQIIARLTVELGILYHKQHSIPYEPLPETMLAEGYGNPVPDVILFDHETEQTRIIIEVCQTAGQNNDLDKVIRLVEQAKYGILEGFVYNYKTRRWLRYRKGDEGQATESAYSDVLALDLATFLE